MHDGTQLVVAFVIVMNQASHHTTLNPEICISFLITISKSIQSLGVHKLAISKGTVLVVIAVQSPTRSAENKSFLERQEGLNVS